MLVIDRLEPVNLERDDHQIVAADCCFRAQLPGAIGKTLAVVQTGYRIGRSEDRCAALLLFTHFGFMLEINITPPAEQDQRDIQRKAGACHTNIRTDRGIA